MVAKFGYKIINIIVYNQKFYTSYYQGGRYERK